MPMPTKLMLLSASALLASCAATETAATFPEAPADDSHLERFRSLAGEWDVDLDGDGQADCQNHYSVTAGGSAIMEAAFVGAPHEMISMIHLDGSRLMLTHYCAARNQPRMVAREIDADSVAFGFLDITNLSDPTDTYIHHATFRFVDADHIVTTWVSSEGGELGEPMTFELTRRE